MEKICPGCQDMHEVKEDVHEVRQGVESRPSWIFITVLAGLLAIGIGASFRYADAQNEQQDKRVDLLRNDVQVLNQQIFILTEVARTAAQDIKNHRELSERKHDR